MLFIAWISTALAITPGGFRHDTARHTDSWGVRNVFVYSPDIEVIDQATPRVNKVFGKYGLDAEISMLGLTGPGGGIFAGVGSLQVGNWWLIESKGGAHHRLGLIMGLPVAPDTMKAHAFGSAYQDTLVDWMGKLGWSVGWNEESPWDLHINLGLSSSSFIDNPMAVSPAIDVALVKVVPVGETTSLVFEQEAMLSHGLALNFRPMFRWDLGEEGASSMDAGLQLPIATHEGLNVTYFTAQIIAQYNSRF